MSAGLPGLNNILVPGQTVTLQNQSGPVGIGCWENCTSVEGAIAPCREPGFSQGAKTFGEEDASLAALLEALLDLPWNVPTKLSDS